MWWVEQAEKDGERERNKRYREMRARRIVDRKLKEYCTALVADCVPCAETLLDRAARIHDLKATARAILTSVR
jgi:hypothetical protein